MAALAFMTSLESRVPFLHFFDGFRTSHEINVIDAFSATTPALVDEDRVAAIRASVSRPTKFARIRSEPRCVLSGA